MLHHSLPSRLKTEFESVLLGLTPKRRNVSVSLSLTSIQSVLVSMHGIFRESQPPQANVTIYQATVKMPCLFDMIFVRKMRRPFADCVSRSHGNQALRDCSPLLSATFSFTRWATTRRQSEMMNEESWMF